MTTTPVAPECFDDEDEPGRCGLTHAQHLATWNNWRDDCLGPDGCGFFKMDVHQCLKGHPDDGVTTCGACGYPGKGIHDPSPNAADLAAALGNLSHAADTRWTEHERRQADAARVGATR